MKKALKLALIYLIILIVGTVLGTIFYSLYLNLLNFIAGKEIVFLNDYEMFNSFFYISFCMLVFINPVISYYRIRHPGGILQFTVYVILCVLTWLILMPGTLSLKSFCERKFPVSTEYQSLTPNYFRQIDDEVYFFTRDFKNSVQGRIPESMAVVIDTSESGTVDSRIVRDYPNFEVNRKALPFREVQLKKIFGEGKNPVPIDFRLLQKKVNGAYGGGPAHLLTLLSFVLLLCTVYGITNFFDWRLLNAVMLFIISASVICFNSLYFNPQFDAIKFRITNNGFFRALNSFISDPLLFLLNNLFALIFIAAGIIRVVIRNHSRKAK